MIKRKYKSAFNVKTSKIDDVETRAAFENRVTKNNSVTENKKFEQIGDETIQKHIKSSFFNNVNNSTRRKNLLRICRIVNSVDYEI